MRVRAMQMNLSGFPENGTDKEKLAWLFAALERERALNLSCRKLLLKLSQHMEQGQTHLVAALLKRYVSDPGFFRL